MCEKSQSVTCSHKAIQSNTVNKIDTVNAINTIDTVSTIDTVNAIDQPEAAVTVMFAIPPDISLPIATP